MDLRQKNEELIIILTAFLNNAIGIKELQDFVWNIIDYFSNTSTGDLPPEEDSENVFWYAIWQVQHLCSEDHIEDGSAYRELEETVAYLKGTKQVPNCCFGRRP